MAGSRLDIQPDMTEVVMDIERQIRELKAAQVVGSDAVSTHFIGSPNQWDINETSESTSWKKVVVVRFTPESTQTNSFAAAFSMAGVAELDGGGQYQQIWMKYKRLKMNSPLYQDWQVTLETADWNGPTAKRVKFYAIATGRGTVAMV